MAGVRREVGPLLLAWQFIGALDLVATVDRALPQHGRSQLSVGEAVAALICSRLCSPSPLYDIAGWASTAALQELFGIPAPQVEGQDLEALRPVTEQLFADPDDVLERLRARDAEGDGAATIIVQTWPQERQLAMFAITCLMRV